MSNSMGKLLAALGLAVVVHLGSGDRLTAASSLPGDDWPQWRHDAHRSAATAARCPDDLALQWMKDFGAPDPAYDHQYRMCADAAYAPVAAGGVLFIPSNIDDSVIACDLETGGRRWRYAAEGPVRVAPLVRESLFAPRTKRKHESLFAPRTKRKHQFAERTATFGKVYFGADDGYLYCVDAADGSLLWRVRGVPEGTIDSRMLVNGRLCSRWPVRGAPVESDGVVFFGAGLWPEEGVYVSAVAADTGEVLWRQDGMSYLREGMSDHGRPYDLGLPPHGYLAVIDGKLAVPSGRSLAAWLDPANGEMEPYSCFYVKLNPPRGTWYLSGIGPYSVQGGNWFATRPDSLPPIPPELEQARSGLYGSKSRPQHELAAAENRPLINAVKYRLHDENLYPEPVLTETTVYASEYDEPTKYLVPRGHTRVSYPAMDRIVARDLTRPKWTLAPEEIYLYPDGTKIRRLEFPVLWELKTPLRVMIKAADRLYAGGEGRIAAIAIPDKGEKPAVVWEALVDGNPVNALVASGRLVVATDTGKVFCFGAGPAKEKPPASGTTAEAPRIPDSGYALCLGAGAARQARALAEAGQHRAVVLEPDARQVASMREQLSSDALRANQVQVIHYTPGMQITPYWANLVVCGSLSRFGPAAKPALDLALNALRPYTGELKLPDDTFHRDLLDGLIEPNQGYELSAKSGTCVVSRAGAPPGSAEWTHEAGGPGNTFSSADRLVKWPLATLWYSGEIDRLFTPASHFQHERNPYPLVTQGRMFLITHETLHAVDIYTGRYLWKAEMPMTEWVEARYHDSRIYGRPVDRNYVATGDSVYVILEEEIHVYSADDGSKQAVLAIPEEIRQQVPSPRWTEVRVDGDVLFSVLGNRLVAMDRHTGEPLWQRKSTLGGTTFTVGDGRVIGLDYVGTELGGSGKPDTVQGPMFVLDARTGETVWTRQVQYDSVPEHKVKNPRPWLLPPNPVLAYNAKHKLIVLAARRNSVHVYRARDGAPVWEKAGASGSIQRTYPPTVTDDYLVLSQYQGYFGYVLDILTGDAGKNRGIPRPRTCARIIGNNSLLVYRDAATELYDIESQRMIGLNSVRSGCTTSFIPAGGILTAPMLGHGCVCNYPMFASQALYHCDQLEPHRPKAVVESWVDQARLLEEATGLSGPKSGAGFPADLAAGQIDLEKLQRINCTVEPNESGMVLRTNDKNAGYAVRKAEQPLTNAVFKLAVRRAGKGRHGNAFFVCGTGDDPEDWIECRLYYGGRSSLMITGGPVQTAEKKVDFANPGVFVVTVAVDCRTRSVTFEAGGRTLTSKMTGPVEAITHYGWGGSNSDNIFTAIHVE